MTSWNLWVWQEPSWIVLANYENRDDALQAKKATCDPPDTVKVVEAGSKRDNFIRQHCTDRLLRVFS